MKNFLWISIVIIMILSSCKKDKLEGDMAILIGKWKWIYTQNEDNSYPYSSSFQQTPLTEKKTCSVEFTHTGKIYVFENGNKKSCYRIVFNSIFPVKNNIYSFSINANNKKKNYFYGYINHQINTDTLFLEGFFPFTEKDPDTYRIYNYFTREN